MLSARLTTIDHSTTDAQQHHETSDRLPLFVASWCWSFHASVCSYGYQGADTDAEQLALTDQFFDAALGEVSIVARGQPCLLVGDFNVEPTKIPCLAIGISAGLWVDLEASWASASGRQPAATCKRECCSSGGRRRDFIVGCPLAAAAVLSCQVQPLAVCTLFDCCGWVSRVTQPFFAYTPLACLLAACC